MPVPFIHNLEKLLDLCEQHDAAFSQMKTLGQTLTPYAVQLRYDEDFWPTQVRPLRPYRAQRRFARSSFHGCPPQCSLPFRTRL